MKKKLILGLIAIGIILISAVYYHTIKDTLKIAKNIDKQYWNLMREIQSAHEKCTFPSTKDLGDSQSFIAHAGGAIIYEGKPYTYSNSKEALLQSINNGYTFIELDLMLDSDGQIFGEHDYKHFYGITNAPKDLIDSNSPPSKDYIKQAKIYGILTPLTRDSINEIFAHNPQVFLVTDKLNDFEAIATQLDFQERILVEVFGLDNYYKARKAGIKYPMLSTNDFRLAKTLGIPMVAAHTGALKDEKTAQLAQEYIANGGCIMMFSTNEQSFIKQHLGVRASKFYTDFWDLQSKDCALSDKQRCKTY